MEQRIQPLTIDPAKLNGLSEKIVRSHHENNYTGAVKRLNAIRGELAALKFSGAPGFQLNGLKREELIATNSMLLHELHFACLGGDGETMAPAMALALTASFGSVLRWKEEFVAMGKALGGGSGWVLLCFQPRDGTLVNQWAADHTHAIAGGVPILALDMYEHAYHMDFGAQAGAWVDAFMRNIDWEAVYGRYQAAVHGATESLAVERSEIEGAQLLDVRRAGVFEQATQMIPGASWRDPAAVQEWAAGLPANQEIVVYCVYGHEVGRGTALRLRSQGFNAKFLRGGIDGWKNAGLALSDKAIPAATAGWSAAKPGGAPEGWQCGSTGGGAPRWSVEPESPDGQQVLKQSGSGRFPWCVKTDSTLANGSVEVKFKAVAGKEDQAGGLVWRWKDGDNYYVARANALENNVSLYYTEDGSRRTIKYVDAPVPANVWHVLRVEFQDAHIRVSLNGKACIDEDDTHIDGAGKVGVWTKADSVTLFSDFTWSPRP